MPQRYLIITGLSILCWSALFAQTANIKWDRYSIEDGLSHTRIKDVIQDGAGFLWFATPDGLNKYDGYSFLRYRHNPRDSTSLPANSINTLHLDRSGILWIGTFNGLCRYDAVRNCFIRYTHPDSSNTTGNFIGAITDDRYGNLWVSRTSLLCRLDLVSGRFTSYDARRTAPFQLQGQIQQITPDPFSNQLWLATSSGIYRFDPDRERFYPINGDPTLPGSTRQYSLAAQAAVRELTGRRRPLAALQQQGDSVRTFRDFQLPAAQKLLVVFLGEGIEDNYYDFGGITGASGKKIWTPQLYQSRHHGGSLKNRIHLQVIDLPAGSYQLHFQSDGSHAVSSWNTHPPKDRAWWGIALYPLTAGEAASLPPLLAQDFRPATLPANRVTCVYADSLPDEQGRQILWGGGAGGLFRLTLPIAADKRIGSYAAGEDRDYAATELAEVQIVHPANRPQLGGEQLTVLDLLHDSSPDKGRRLWIATSGSGLIHMDLQAGRFAQSRSYLHSPQNSSSLSGNTVTALHQDHSGNLWASTHDGVSKLNRKKLQFTHLTRFHPDTEGTSAQRNVTAIHETSSGGELWIATEAGGLTAINPAAAGTHHVRFIGLEPDEHPGQMPVVRSIAQRRKGPEEYLWLATADHGLARLNTRSSAVHYITRAIHKPWEESPPNTLPGNRINLVYPDTSGSLWLGMENAGLSRVFVNEQNKAGRIINYLASARQDSTTLLSNQIWAIAEDLHAAEPALWIGTVGGHLSRLDIKSGVFTHFREKGPGIPGHLNSKSITALLFSQDGTLWVGTYSGGLNRFDRHSETFSQFTVQEGLANNMVAGILEDNHGKLWISTNSGLSVLDPQRKTFRNYDVNDGLQSNQFNIGSALRGRDGKMFFGGVNGFNCFYPDSLIENRREPVVLLTDFRIFDRSVLPGAADKHPSRHFRAGLPLSRQPEIQLDYADNFFSFSFVALDYTNPHKNEYAYQLRGFDRDWVRCGDRRYASYTNLDPGRYTFQVKAANSDGVWNNRGVAIDIIIHPPFWKTWWFYLLCLALAGSLIYAYINFHIRQKLRQMVAIERVRKKAAADFHDELGHKLTRISLFSELVKRNLNGASAEAADYLQRINDISGGLYHGMRDFLWTLDPGKDSLFEAAIRLKDFGDEFFDKTGITFEVEGIDERLRCINLNMDWKRHLILLFKEAMTNTLRHARCHHVQLKIDLQGDEVQIKLLDDGCGAIDAQSNGNGKALHPGRGDRQSGHGIRNMNYRAEQLNGLLTIGPADGSAGTVVAFRAMLPV